MFYNVLLPDINSISDSKRFQNISIIFHISPLEGFGTGGLAGKQYVGVNEELLKIIDHQRWVLDSMIFSSLFQRYNR